MYVVTFYSYKGGVGRSMALSNVAALLAAAGKRVLLVDFDLEAPGLPSYRGLGNAAGLPGVVDYVEQYRRDLKAPDVSEFIVECELAKGGRIWVMPAGDNASPAYTERLGAIDWNELYNDEFGYLMFEDLRQQWQRHEASFDYVLIDSRTGHTDVGGICTRQLPDAVVVMFVPTEQNILGLVPIVKGIRSAKRPSGRAIKLHFCASNVPDEYDENGVLERLLKSAHESLGYGSQASIEPRHAIVHHRTHLDLLDQDLAVETFPKSKLAKEYADLRTSIIGENLADRDGAMIMLERLPEVYEAARRRRDGRVYNDISEHARTAKRLHPRDGEIALAAARVFAILDEYVEELESLGTAIDMAHRADFARLRRAGVLLKQGKEAQALDDLRAVLASPTATIFEFQPATRLLATAAQDPVAEAIALFDQPETRPRAKVVLAQQLLMSNRDHMSLLADEMRRILANDVMSEDLSGDVRNIAELASIAIRDFKGVLEIPRPDDSVPDLFNIAIAQWGLSGDVPVELFKSINAMPAPAVPDANVHQCFAVVKDAIGDREGARVELECAMKRITPAARIFSCWTYTYKVGERLLEDLEEMKSHLDTGRSLKPPFLDQSTFEYG